MNTVEELIGAISTEDGEKAQGYILSLSFRSKDKPATIVDTNGKHSLDLIGAMVAEQYKQDGDLECVELAISEELGFNVKIINTDALDEKAKEILGIKDIEE